MRDTRLAALALAIVAIGAAPVPAGPADISWLIVPGVRVGAITRDAGELDLIRAYGLGNVRKQGIEVGEGIVEQGTVVFPNDPQKSAAILWKDLSNNRMPERIQITGSRSLWRTAEGITLGTSLREIERANGRPFVLTGFGWDYGGTIIGWQRGRLERPFTTDGRVILRLRPPAGAGRSAGAVTGDREFRSSHKAMQQINPRVYQIIVEFK